MPEGVIVEFTGPFREIAQARNVTIEIEGKTTLEGLIRKLSEMYGEEFGKRIISEEGTGIRADSAMVAINQRVIDLSKALSQPVAPGDRVVFALAITGGG